MEVAFLLHAGSPVQNSEFHFRSELRERTFAVGVFQLRDRSALYSAPGGANGFEPNERLHPFDPTVTTVGRPTDAPNSYNCWQPNSRGAGCWRAGGLDLERSGSGSGSGADARNPYPRDLIQKEPGRVDPDPDPARARPGTGRPTGRRRRQRRRARMRMPACAGIVPSFSRAKTPSTQRARPLFSTFSIYTPQTSIPWPMWD